MAAATSAHAHPEVAASVRSPSDDRAGPQVPGGVAQRRATPPAVHARRPTRRALEGYVERFDDAAAAWALRSRRVRALDRAMYLLSSWGDDGRIWIVAAAVESARVRSPRRFVALVAWLGLESAIVNLGIKRVARRPRPDTVTDHEFWLRIPSDTSFPSGHAASSALMAVLLCERSPLAPVWIVLAAGIGASRVHVGVHHGTDVAAGWLVGAGIGGAARALGRHPMFDLGSPRRHLGSVPCGPHPSAPTA